MNYRREVLLHPKDIIALSTTRDKMIFKKTITTSIDIENPIDIYTAPDKNLIIILRDRYEGKCFRSCYIIQVISIIDTSECIIDTHGNDSSGTVNIKFDARVIEYLQGEIINGCEIKSKTPTSVTLSTREADIYMKPSPLFESIKEKQLMPLRVWQSSYQQGTSKASINATPYLPVSKQSIYFTTSAKFSAKESTVIAGYISAIRKEEELRDKIVEENAQGWKYFNDLMYAYKTVKPAPSDAEEINIFDLATGITEGYYSRDLTMDMSKSAVHRFPSVKNQNDAIVSFTPSKVVEFILCDYLNYIKHIRGMVETYNTKELLISHKNLWAIYTKSKLQ